MNKWAAFWLLAVIWGSSFLLIRIGVQELNPFQVVFIRTLIAAIGLNIVVLVRGKRLPTDWQSLKVLILLGLGNTVVPFTLITWGEKSIDSGLASVLQATATLFTLVIAHFALRDERITLQRALGLLLGFVGVCVLASRSWAGGELQTGDLFGQLAIVVASLFYAIFIVYTRRVGPKIEPIVMSAGAMTTAALASGVLTLASPLWGETATPLSALSGDVLWAVLLLGFVNTFIAYLIFYSLVQSLGASRTSTVTYVIPVVGLALGVVFLGEVLDLTLIVGAALIFAGIGAVNLRARRRLTPAVSAPLK